MTIRKATPPDLPALGPMGAALATLHHQWDPRRFMSGGPDLEAGYTWWFGQELNNPNALLFVAEENGQIVGYSYGRREGKNWNALLDDHVALIDLYIHPDHRQKGLARALVHHFIDQVRPQTSRIILSTAPLNTTARALFTSLGFRTTFIEMMLELNP